jgi:hypothetical protein
MKALAAIGAAIVIVVGARAQQPQAPQAAPAVPRIGDQSFKFRSGVELINVTATVSDASGRFVSGLKQDDFVVYEDDQPQAVTHFRARSTSSCTNCSISATRFFSIASATTPLCCRTGPPTGRC